MRCNMDTSRRRVRLAPETNSPVEQFFAEVVEDISREIRPFLEGTEKWMEECRNLNGLYL